MAEPVPTPVEAFYEPPELLVELDTRTDQKNGFYVILAFSMYTVTSIIMIYLTSVHRRYVYKDLGGDKKTREILFAHRVKKNRSLPERTMMYQRINLFSFYAMLFFTCSSLSGALSFTSRSDFACSMFLRFIIAFVEAGKSMMYLVFLMRLQRLYAPSPYGYPSSCFLFFYFAIVVYGVSVIAACFFIVDAQIFYWGAEGESRMFPNLCQAANVTQFIQFATAVVVEDVGVTIGFIWAYKIPLKKTYDAFAKKSPKTARKVAYMGYKMAVLTGAATISTLILSMITALTQLGCVSIPDVIISSCCLMFMSAYYIDEYYYRRYCKCCIFCCHSHNAESNLEQALIEEISYMSADTGSQVRRAGAKLTIELKEFQERLEENEQELQEIKQDIKEIREQKEEETGNDNAADAVDPVDTGNGGDAADTGNGGNQQMID